MSQVMHYTHDGQPCAVTLTPLGADEWQATINGETYTLRARPAADGGWLLAMDGQQQITYCAAQGDERHIHAEGQVFSLSAADQRPRRRSSAGAAGDLSAQMPGQVREVLGQAGQAVTAGQTLVILEAMKMELRVTAPADGTVRRVLVSPGDVVTRGQTLVEIDQ